MREHRERDRKKNSGKSSSLHQLENLADTVVISHCALGVHTKEAINAHDVDVIAVATDGGNLPGPGRTTKLGTVVGGQILVGTGSTLEGNDVFLLARAQ